MNRQEQIDQTLVFGDELNGENVSVQIETTDYSDHTINELWLHDGKSDILLIRSNGNWRLAFWPNTNDSDTSVGINLNELMENTK